MSQERHWITFYRTSRPRLDKTALQVRLTNACEIWITMAAWNEIGQPERVSFKVDSKRRAIAIVPAEPGYSIKVGKTSQTGNLTAVRITSQAIFKYLFRQLGLAKSQLPLICHVYVEDRMLIIDLNEDAETE